jgi:opacity protein-like surface antigen
VKRVVAYLAGMLACGASAMAQENAASDGVYVRVGGGVSFASDWSQDYTFNPSTVFAVAPPTGQTVANGDGYVIGGAIGFDYADGIRTELEYRYASTSIDTLTINDPTLGPTLATPVNDEINVHFLMSNFYFDWTNDSRFTPFIGGGVGGAFVENETGARDAALAYQGRAGVSLDVGGGFSLDTEYIYLRTSKLSYGPEDEDFTAVGPIGPRIDGDRYEASNVMVSIRKQF